MPRDTEQLDHRTLAHVNKLTSVTCRRMVRLLSPSLFRLISLVARYTIHTRYLRSLDGSAEVTTTTITQHKVKYTQIKCLKVLPLCTSIQVDAETATGKEFRILEAVVSTWVMVTAVLPSKKRWTTKYLSKSVASTRIYVDKICKL